MRNVRQVLRLVTEMGSSPRQDSWPAWYRVKHGVRGRASEEILTSRGGGLSA